MRLRQACAFSFYLGLAGIGSPAHANFVGGEGLMADGSVCEAPFYREILHRSQGTGKVNMVIGVSKSGVVEDIAIVNSVNNAVLEEASIAWKKTCKFPADHATSGSGWQESAVRWSDESYKDDDNFVYAFRNFKRQAANGNAGAMFRVAYMIEKGHGTTKGGNLQAAKPWYFKAAEAGDARAQSWLGRGYMFGEGLKQDPVEAIRWLRLAAANGDAEARNVLGRWYERPGNAEHDLRQASTLYRQAFEKGDFDGRIGYARLLLSGLAEDSDPVRAAALYRQAAEAGDPRGMSALSALYASGTGVKADPELAEKWLADALKFRDPQARVMRGNQLMQEGQSAAACDWYRQGAERGHAPAQSRLARCFETGTGMPQDARRARLWYGQARLEDDAAAIAGMARLAENGPVSGAAPVR